VAEEAVASQLTAWRVHVVWLRFEMITAIEITEISAVSNVFNVRTRSPTTSNLPTALGCDV
jgi:hypothetical protein